MKRLQVSLLISLLLLSGCKGRPYQPSGWLATVPAPARAQQSPLPRDPRHDAVNTAQGGQLYGMYCSSCHGAGGAGSRARPSLRNGRVRGETDGEIHWILVNGSKGHGMPAWRSLGDPALWQLVEYIRSMPPEQR